MHWVDVTGGLVRNLILKMCGQHSGTVSYKIQGTGVKAMACVWSNDFAHYWFM